MKDNNIAYLTATVVGVAFAAVCVGAWVGIIIKVATWVANL